MNKDRVVIGSPPDYKQLVAEVVIDDVVVALISRDAGDDQLEIELLIEHKEHEGIDLERFVFLLEKAKNLLLSYDRVED